MKDVELKISADASGVDTGMQKAASAVSSGVAQMREQFEGFKSTLDAVSGTLNTAFQIAGIGIAIEGVKQFGEQMARTAENAVHLEHTARMLGVGTTELQGLHAAAREAGVGAEEFDHAIEQLELKMQTARDGSQEMRDKLGAVGITLADLSDGSFTAADAAYAMAASHATEAEKMDVVGRRGIVLVAALENLKGGQAGAIEKGRELGALTDEQLHSLDKYHKAITDVGIKLENWAGSIAASLSPALTGMFDTLNRIWQDALKPVAEGLLSAATYTVELVGAIFAGLPNLDLFRNIWTSIGLVVKTAASAFAIAATGVTFFGALAVGIIEEVLAFITKLATGVVALFAGDFKGAAAIAGSAFSGIGDQVSTTMAEWNRQADKLGETLKKIWKGPEEEVPEIVVTARRLKGHNKIKDNSESGERFQAMKVELERIKDEAGAFRQHDIAADIEYWQQKLSLVKGNTKQDSKLRLEVENEILQNRKKLAAEDLKIDEEIASHKKAMALEDIKIEQEMLGERLAEGEISKEQEIRGLIDLEQRKYRIEQQGLKDRLKLVEADRVERRKLLDQLELLQKQHNAELVKLDTQSTKEMIKSLQPVQKQFEKMLDGMLHHTMTFRSMMRGIWAGIEQNIIHSLASVFTKHIATEEAKTAATAAGAAERTALENSGAQEGLLVQAGAAIKSIMNNAYKAASGAFNAVVDIPYVGPILAPIAAAAAFTAVAAFGGSVASSAGGYDIPAGVNPLVQAHAKETILPAGLSDAFREGARRINQPGGGGGGRGSTANISVSALDGASLSRVVRSATFRRELQGAMGRSRI